MAIGSISLGTMPLPASPAKGATGVQSNRLDNDGDYDNGAPEPAKGASTPSLPSDPNRGRTLNITA